MLTFHIPGPPPTATSQQKGVRVIHGKPTFFKRAHVAQAEHDMATAFAPYRPAAPLAGPLAVSIVLVWPFRKADKPPAFGVVAMDTRPDLDNLAKLILDGMTKLGFWQDDSQISQLMMSKYRGHAPGITVLVECMTKHNAGGAA